MSEILLLLLFVVLVIACGIFVAAEFSFLAVNKTAVEQHARSGDHKSQGILSGLKSLSTQLSGAQVGITITNLGIGLITEPLLSPLLTELLSFTTISSNVISIISIIVGTILASFITMIFGELIPKNLAIARPLATARFVQGYQRGFSRLMRFPIKLLNKSANYIIRRFGVEPTEELASARSADELTSLVRRSAEHGTLEKQTAIMLERSIQFDEMIAEDIMTPRIRLKTLDKSSTVQDLIELSAKTGHSRFPVYGRNVDDILGVTHIKQAIKIEKSKRKTTPIESIIQKALFIPSSLKLDNLLISLRTSDLQARIVIDEYGGTDGFVTIEDLIEELVGEVQDEHDPSSKRVVAISPQNWKLAGILRIDEVAERTDVYLPETEDYETVGGLIYDTLERMPIVGDEISIKAIDRQGSELKATLEVLDMDNMRVDHVSLKVRKVKVK